jgi:hypothetical protein
MRIDWKQIKKKLEKRKSEAGWGFLVSSIYLTTHKHKFRRETLIFSTT